MKTFTVVLNLPLEGMNTNNFLESSRKMIVPQWVIGCWVNPYIEVFRKMAEQYYPDKTDVCKDAVSIPGISMAYVLNKSLEKNKKLELYSPGGICHICREKREELQHCSCNGALKFGGYCEECQLDMQALDRCECEKAAVYELLRTGMVGGPAQVLKRYDERDITHP